MDSCSAATIHQTASFWVHSSSIFVQIGRRDARSGRFVTTEEIIGAIEAVAARELQEIAQEQFRAEKIAAAVLGSLDGFRVTREELAC